MAHAIRATKSVPSTSEARRPGKSGQQLGDIAARRLPFHRRGDGAAVVFHQEQKRQLIQAGRVDGLPELAFAGGSFAGADERDLIGIGPQVKTGVGAAHGSAPSACRWAKNR